MKFLDQKVGLKESECAWDHNLVALAKMLAAKRPDFDLTAVLKVPFYLHVRRGLPTVATTLAMFDPFFEELRYPRELKELDGIGPDDWRVLDALFAVLAPFMGNVTVETKPPSPETALSVPSSGAA